MAANYPDTQPSLTGSVGAEDDPLDTPDHATQHTDESEEIEAIAAELGTNASGHASTVRDAIATHAARHEPGGADAMTVDAAAGTGSLRTLGTGSQQAAVGSHAGQHEEGGADPVKRVLLNRIAAGTSTTVSTPCSLVGCTSEGITITLASAMLAGGAWIDVVDESGAAGTTAITVDTEGTETIDGASSQTIAIDHGQLRLYSDGTNWFTR